jgi:hypothetical protein
VHVFYVVFFLQSIEGPPVPVEAVMDVIMFADLSPAALAQAAAELDSGHLPSGANGIVPNALLQGRYLSPVAREVST